MEVLAIIGGCLLAMVIVGFVLWLVDSPEGYQIVNLDDHNFANELTDSYRSLYSSTAEKLDLVSKKKDRATIHITKLYAEKKQYENMIEALLHITKDQQLTRPQILVVRNIRKSLSNLARK